MGNDMGCVMQNVDGGKNSTANLVGLEGNMGYIIVVFAYNEFGISCPSAPLGPILTAPVVPTKVTEVRCIQALADSMSLLWNAPAKDGGEEVMRYCVKAEPQPAPGVIAKEVKAFAASTEITITDLLGNTNYLITVKAENKVGFS